MENNINTKRGILRFDSPVTTIYPGAFTDSATLTSITIPRRVNTISYEVVRYCPSLTSIIWEAENCSIQSAYGALPFQLVSGQITDFVFGQYVRTIPEYLCKNMTNLLSITIPSNVTSIAYNAFRGCSSIASIEVADRNHTYDSRDNCNAIIETATNKLIVGCQNTIIPNSVSIIGEEAFNSSSSLTSITIPDNVTDIQKGAFKGCSSLASINLGNGVSYIAEELFKHCSSLTSIVIPSSVSSMGNYAFYGCTSLNSVDLSNNIRNISKFAFYDCSALTSITIPNSVTRVGEGVFHNCSALESIVWNAEKCSSASVIEEAPFYGITSQIKSFILGENVESIPNYLCYGMEKLTSITIPNSVKWIAPNAFDGTGIYNDESNWENNVLYIDDCLIKAKTSISGAYTIKENTRLIVSRAFSNCASLTSIVIPNSVTSIEGQTFYGCYFLTSVTLPNSVTSIGNTAFSGCSRLTSITIPESVTSIGGWAFDSCSSLTSITIPNSVTSINSSTFKGCDSLTSITIPNSVISIGNEAFRNCSSLTSVIIGNNVTSIGSYAFNGCTSLTSITCKATTPPTLNSYNELSNVATVYVPAESVEAYKAASDWSYYSEVIQPIPS